MHPHDPTPATDARLPRVVMATTVFPRWPGDFKGHFVAELADALAPTAEVTVVAPHDRGSGPVPSRARVVRFRYGPDVLERTAYRQGIPANVRRDPIALMSLIPFILCLLLSIRRESRDADIIHAHWIPTAMLATLVARNTPVVVTVHGTDLHLGRRSRVWSAITRATLRRVAAVIVVSDEQASQVLEMSSHTDGTVSVIPNGVREELLDRAMVDDDPAGSRIVFVGRLIREKGAYDIVTALASIDGLPSLLMLGDGPERGALERLAHESRVFDAVDMRGDVHHDEALDAIAAADVLVLPSYAEGCPLSVLEALALGTPVVAYRTGGLPEMLGEAGVIVEQGDIDGLAREVTRILDDAGLRRRFAAEGRQRAADAYTWSRIAERTRTVYRDVTSDELGW